MILYLDTSALVKLYVEEEFSDIVEKWVEKSDIIASSAVAYAEIASAFRRILEEKRVGEEDVERVWKYFITDWEGYTKVWVTQKIVNFASRLIFKYKLKGFDGIHLASAIYIAITSGREVVFVSFDEKLNKAANIEGFPVVKSNFLI